jgi:hypothetical protein
MTPKLTIRSCSHCHRGNDVTAGPTICPRCAHRADVPRMDCDCGFCRPVAGALKPWPSDAVMIVAANAGEENRANMEGVHPCVCRVCSRELAADKFSVRRAEQLPQRMGRPEMFFCAACASQHDVGQVTVFEDHRERTLN